MIVSGEKKRRGFLLPACVALAVAGVAAYAFRAQPSPDAGAPKAAPAVPVTTASASISSFPVLLDGLGTVQAYNTVTVRTRVDGQIDTVAFTEGQMVKKGDLLVQIDPRPYQAALEQAQAKKAQDEATLVNGKADLARYTKLGDYATRQQLDTQTATVNSLTAQIASDQAAIDNAQTQLSYATIRSPIDGLAGFRQVDAGNIVNAATQTGIVTLTQLEPISVVFTAPEDQLTEISRALKSGDVPVAALSTDGARKLADGKLEIINNQVDTASGTIRLKATFENKGRALWPGLSVTTRTLVNTIENALTLPDDAVQHGPNGLFAYVVSDDQRARIRPIKVGRSGDGRAVIADGLKSGEKVIVQGQYRVQDGVRVVERTAPLHEAAAENP